MSSVYTYPGVYIQELPSPVHSITGVATSITAFVGYTARGIDNRAQAIYSFADFQRLYGGLASNSEVSYAVQQFYQNGGGQAYVVRTPMHYPAGAVAYAEAGFGVPQAPATAGLTFSALSSGVWANGQLLVDVDVQGLDLTTATGDPLAFNLTITNLADGTVEYFPAVSLNSNQQNFVAAVVNDPDNGSQLVNVKTGLPTAPTALTVTGLLGTPLPYTLVSGVNYLEGVNTVLGGSGTATTASADCSLTLHLPATFTPDTYVIKIIGSGAPISQTVQGLASQLQQAINTALAINVAGASVVCSAAPNGTKTFGIRVNALLPNAPDAIISFSAPTGAGTLNNASAALGLTAPTSSNVAALRAGHGRDRRGAALHIHSGNGAERDHAAAEWRVDWRSAGLYGHLRAEQGADLQPAEHSRGGARAVRAIPTPRTTHINPVEIYSAAIALCDQCRAMLLVDPPPNMRRLPALWIGSATRSASWPYRRTAPPSGRALRLSDPLNNGAVAHLRALRAWWQASMPTPTDAGRVEGAGRHRSRAERRAEHDLHS